MATDATRTVLAGLDPEQRRAVTAPAGPVCILAGAGTGKTRAITHRIAYRVVTGEIAARHVLAVTFTARAAGQLRERLPPLGAPGVADRTAARDLAGEIEWAKSNLVEPADYPAAAAKAAREAPYEPAKVAEVFVA